MKGPKQVGEVEAVPCEASPPSEWRAEQAYKPSGGEPAEVRETRVVNVHQQPVSVKLVKGSKGSYRWEIQVHASEPAEALHLLSYLNDELNRRYGQPQTINAGACQGNQLPNLNKTGDNPGSRDLFPETPSELWRRVRV